MKLETAQIIGGHFKIIAQIGQGGFGETYLAEDLQSKNKKCVVKCFNFLSREQQIVEKAKSLFQREGDVLFRLTEINSFSTLKIPRFLAYFEENNYFYLVQEFLEGKTIREEIKEKGNLTELEVISLLKNVLETLHFIHKNQIIHRDIKPENLIKNYKNNQIYLIDFGAVKEKISQLTQVGTNIQTIGYAPMEQYLGNAQYNSDIYALGITAIEALTGLSPSTFYSSSLDKFIYSNQLQISQKIQEILTKMVAFDYQYERYQSAADVLQDLEQLKTNCSLKNTLPLPTEIIINKNHNYLSKSTPKNRKILIFIAGLSSIVLGILIALFNLLNNPTTPTPPKDFTNPPLSQPKKQAPIRFKKVPPPTENKSSFVEQEPNKSAEKPAIRFKKANPK